MKLLTLLLIAVATPYVAQAQALWQGEWGSFADPKALVGGRLSIHDCTTDHCTFSIERSSGTGRLETSVDLEMTLLTANTASADMHGHGDTSPCTLQFSRKDRSKPVITVAASGESCLRDFGTGTNVSFSGTYPLRARASFEERHRDECFFKGAPAKLAICESPPLARLESGWFYLAYDSASTGGKDDSAAVDRTDEEIIHHCDHASDPGKCLEARYIADIEKMQAAKDAELRKKRNGPSKNGGATAPPEAIRQ